MNNYLCNWCPSPLMLWVQLPLRVRCTTLCDKICQGLAAGRWFSLGPPVSSTNKTDHHDITEILLKVVLNTIKPTNQPYVSMTATLKVFSLFFFNIKIQLIDQIHINLFFVVSGLSSSPIEVKSRW